GAVGGHGERRAAVGARLDHLDDLRDDVAGALHAHGVALADVLALDVVDVVEVGTADGDAADVHGPQHGDGRDDAGAAHARHDAQDLADLLARLELDGVRPARVVGGVAQAVAQVEVLQLHDHAV